MAADHRISKSAAKYSIRENYESLYHFMSADPKSWAIKFKQNHMISETAFEYVKNGFHESSNKALEMLHDIENYIKGACPDHFWQLVKMLNENKNGGTLAQKLVGRSCQIISKLPTAKLR